MLFADIVGKSQVKELLVRQINAGHMPHAQLFAGQNGFGSLAMALATTQYLLCDTPTGKDACGQCPSCAKTSKLIHPDVHFSFPVVPKKSGSKPVSNDYLETWREVALENPHLSYIDWMERIGAENKQGNITKEECRSIIQKLSLKAYENKAKVLILWLPEYLGKEGNSLLKLIEEPPENTYFFLVTENPDGILPTILSRTQLVAIPPYTSNQLVDALTNQGETGDVNAVAFLANGDWNAAQKLSISTENNLSDVLKTWMRLCFRKDVPGLMKWSDEMGGKGRENIKNFLHYALGVFREVLAYKVIPEYSIRLGESEQQFVSNFSGVIQFTNIEVLYEGLNEGISQIERNANPKLTLFQLSLTLRNSFIETQKADKR
ncbi:MAG: DNA polymerase III subunit delta [Bacteroidia bacterium]|nr:DNA polymerase III subunit delta [Bacteroidia bacterium]